MYTNYPQVAYRFGALGASRAITNFDGIKVEKGKKYKVWFLRPSGLTDSLWNIVYNGKNVGLRYTDYWNNGKAIAPLEQGGLQSLKANKNRFEITRGAELVDGGKYIYLEGTGGSTGETFGTIALDRAWATMNPLWDKALGIIWRRRGVEGIRYYMIADETGVTKEPEGEYPVGVQPFNPLIYPDGGGPAKSTVFPWGTVAIAGAAVVAIGAGVYVWSKSRKSKRAKKA
jgi:hypothetical protein